jgi:hypothetical protein
MGVQFDITDKCLSFIKQSIEDMPANEGQKSLVKNLNYDGYCYIDYEASIPAATATYDWEITSSHPEAIYQIIEHAYDSAELIAKQAETILPVFSPDEWIIAGWDG